MFSWENIVIIIFAVCIIILVSKLNSSIATKDVTQRFDKLHDEIFHLKTLFVSPNEFKKLQAAMDDLVIACKLAKRNGALKKPKEKEEGQEQ